MELAGIRIRAPAAASASGSAGTPWYPARSARWRCRATVSSTGPWAGGPTRSVGDFPVRV